MEEGAGNAISEFTRSFTERFDKMEARFERIDECFAQIEEISNETRDLIKDNESIARALAEGNIRSEWEKEYGCSPP